MCEQEGEGPCLFCGAWVDRETMYEIEDEDDLKKYETALEHRDKLIDFDINAAKRLGVLDERSDWYDLSGNTWLNKEQRKFASEQLVKQEKKQEELDSQMTVDVNLNEGTAFMRMNETDPDAAFFKQVEQANEYMAE